MAHPSPLEWEQPVKAEPRAHAGSRLALATLVALTVISPWPMGSVHPATSLGVSCVCLATAALAVWPGTASIRGASLWPLAGLLGLAVLQLLPLPPALLAILAPGSNALWHPAEPAALEVLGQIARPVSTDPEATIRWIAFFAGLSALALLAAPTLASGRRARLSVAVVSAGALALSLYAVIARSLFGPLLFGRFPVPTVAPFGPFVSKNHFAGYAEMSALLALGLAAGLADRERSGRGPLAWTAAPRAGRVMLAYGTAAALPLGVLFSLSRGGAVSLVAGGAFFAAFRMAARRRREPHTPHPLLPLVAAAASAAALLAVLPGEARERMNSLQNIGAESSGTFRVDTWMDTVRMAAASPLLGHGFGSFADAFTRYKRGHGDVRVEHAENDYLETLAEGGLVGAGLALAAVGVFLLKTGAALSRRGDPLMRGLGLGALAGMVALLVHSAVDFNLRIPSNALLFSFLGAMALAAADLVGPSQVRAGAGRLAPATLLLSLAAAAILARPESSPESRQELARAASSGTEAARRLHLQKTEAGLRAEVRSHPAHAEAWFLLGWTRAAMGDVREGTALASYAVRLDPNRPDLERELRRIFGRPRG